MVSSVLWLGSASRGQISGTTTLRSTGVCLWGQAVQNSTRPRRNQQQEQQDGPAGPAAGSLHTALQTHGVASALHCVQHLLGSLASSCRRVSVRVLRLCLLHMQGRRRTHTAGRYKTTQLSPSVQMGVLMMVRSSSQRRFPQQLPRCRQPQTSNLSCSSSGSKGWVLCGSSGTAAAVDHAARGTQLLWSPGSWLHCSYAQTLSKAAGCMSAASVLTQFKLHLVLFQ